MEDISTTCIAFQLMDRLLVVVTAVQCGESFPTPFHIRKLAASH